MGQFAVEVKAVGNHGCNRQVKDGEAHIGCQHRDCPDCVAREFVRRLVAQGTSVESATLIHWPDTENEVRENLLTGVRTGNF